MKFIVIRLITVCLLFFAIDKQPYGYYQILRWVVCGVAGYSAFLSFELYKNNWTWIFIITAILFNPIAPIHLDKDTWAVIDFTVAIMIFLSIFIINAKRSTERQ